ncbi:18087_t:CDS:10 [Funneliformis geosporum]|uniref:19138_t:CDS:1 n=1 Tax=Funneliformis geosporum TaxID=1117311 RepID=A0A9W4SRC9_9GLOM|nr:18087_t:CDS:10 [Funneliformis geosporum]CAI2176354.1 19138_t:CDS:10 [Funneliformis geosporum]
MENSEDEMIEHTCDENNEVNEQNFTESIEPLSPITELAERSSYNNINLGTNPNRRASIAVSRFNNMIDPNIIGSWISNGIGYGSQVSRTKRRATVIDHDSVKSGFVSLRAPDGVDLSMFNEEVSDVDLPQEFEKFLNEMNIQGPAREKMLQLSIDQKRTILLTHKQAQEIKQQSQSQYFLQQSETLEQLRPESQTYQQKNFLNDYDTMSDMSGKIQIRDSDVASATSATSENYNAEQKPNNRLSLSYWLFNTEQNRSSSPPLTNVPEQINPVVQSTSQNRSSGLFGSLLYLYPSAGNSTKLQDTPDFYIEKLTQKNAAPKLLADTLLSLRITLSSAKLSWLREFLENKGLVVLDSILEKHTIRDKRSTARNSDQDDRIQSQFLTSSSLVASIVFCLHTTNNKLRSQVADVLAALCVLSLDGHKLVVGSFTEFRVVHEEKFRFHYLVESLRRNEDEDSTSIEYKAAGLSLINAIVNSPDIIEERILLREEFERRGIDNVFKVIKDSDPPESVLKQIEVYQEERQEDLDELYEKAHEIVRGINDPLSIVAGLLQQLESDRNLHRRVIETLKNLLRISCKSTGERYQNEIWTLLEQFIEQIISLNNLGQEWQKFMKEYHSSIQHIVGKYSLVSGNVTDEEIDSLRTRVEGLIIKNERKITAEEMVVMPTGLKQQTPNQNLSHNNLDKQQSIQTIPQVPLHQLVPGSPTSQMSNISSNPSSISTSPLYFPKLMNIFRQSSIPAPILNQQHPSDNNLSHPTSSKSIHHQQHKINRKPPPPPPPKIPSSSLSIVSQSKTKKPPFPAVKNETNFTTEFPHSQQFTSNNNADFTSHLSNSIIDDIETSSQPIYATLNNILVSNSSYQTKNNEIIPETLHNGITFDVLSQSPSTSTPTDNIVIPSIPLIPNLPSINKFDIPSIPSLSSPPPPSVAISPPPQTVGIPPPPPPPPPGTVSLQPLLTEDSNSINNASVLYDNSPIKANFNKPKGPLKQLFWSKISNLEVNNTVWKDIQDEDIPLNTNELDELFSKTVAVTSENGIKVSVKATVTTLLDFNRANNIAIMLARIKMPYSEIKNAILELDDEKLSVENLRSIKQYVPNSEEIELVKEYDGDLSTLGNAENYFREIMIIPRMSERLNCMIFRRRFEIEVQELLPEITMLHDAYEDLKNSPKFKKLLKTVLAIGNYLNAKSFRGNASGFQLDALLKMRDTKATENNSKGTATLLHYLAFTIESNQKELITFMDELPHLEAAARVSVVTVMSSVTSLVTGVSQIKEEMRVLKRIRLITVNDRFLEVMDDFVKQVESTIQRIQETATNLDNELKQMLIYYGEDPKSIKPEDFFGLIVSFSSSIMKARKENEDARKKTNKKPSDAISIASSNDAQGDFDDAIRELRSGLKRNRGRPVSKVFLEIEEDPNY